MSERRTGPLKRVPPGAVQHRTAGPYSPVIEIDAGGSSSSPAKSPSVPTARSSATTIEEQTRATLENCRKQLDTAGASLADVFKVNVYLSDLAEWSALQRGL